MKNNAFRSFRAVAALAAALVCGFVCAADATVEEPVDDPEVSILDKYVDLSTELAFYSAYVWRGQILFDRSVWQPAQNVFFKFGENAEYGALKFRLWANFAIDGNKPPHRFGGMSIVDERVGYVKTFFDCLDFDVGAIMYQFPNRHSRGLRETDELLAGVKWRNPYVTPSFYVWWDFDETWTAWRSTTSTTTSASGTRSGRT